MENTPDPIGILVFVSQETLDHKINDGKSIEDRYCYWDTARMPKKFIDTPDTVKRIYMAVKGQVMGYFIISGLRAFPPFRFIFFSESWVHIEDGPVLKPSQGWRYFSHPQTSTNNDIHIMDDHPDPVLASRRGPVHSMGGMQS